MAMPPQKSEQDSRRRKTCAMPRVCTTCTPPCAKARACNHLMHSSNAGYHGLGRAAGTVNCHHSGKPCPAQPPDRIQTEGRVFPEAGAHTRFGELHDHRGDAADEKGKRVLEHGGSTGCVAMRQRCSDP